MHGTQGIIFADVANHQYFIYHDLTYNISPINIYQYPDFIILKKLILAILTHITKHKCNHYRDGYMQNSHTFCEKSGPNSSFPEP